MSRATFLDVREGSIVALLLHHVDPDGHVFENILFAPASNELCEPLVDLPKAGRSSGRQSLRFVGRTLCFFSPLHCESVSPGLVKPALFEVDLWFRFFCHLFACFFFFSSIYDFVIGQEPTRACIFIIIIHHHGGNFCLRRLLSPLVIKEELSFGIRESIELEPREFGISRII